MYDDDGFEQQEEVGPNRAAVAQAAERLKWPALSIIILGVLDILTDIGTMIAGGAWMESLAEQMAENNPDLDPDMFQVDWTNPLNLASTCIGFAITGVAIFGGVQMMKVKMWGMALTAAIITMVPCMGPCCGLGFPIGIWALVMLMKPEIKEAF